MLRAGVRHLDAVVFTHQHKDHIAGLDDVRPFNYRSGNDMPIYATAAVEEALRREFAYAFGAVRYPGAPLLELRTISHQSPFEVCGRVLLQPIEAMHYLMPVLGFRHGDFTYLTDAKTIAETEFEKMRGTRVLVINALHHAPHISHFNLEEALAVIARLQPERAYLTHLSHHFGRHVDEQPRLPKGVYMAYDGLVLDDIA